MQKTAAILYLSRLNSGAAKGAEIRRKRRRKEKSRIAGAARYYLLTRGYGEETPCRFDVVAVLEDEVRLIQDAFWL